MMLNPKSAAVRLDRSRHAAPQVFERLREQILSLELAPGSVLSRAELAEHFGISQTPIRDALIKLGEEGLVDIFPQHATVVSRISISSARQAHFLRKAIEAEVVHTLAAAPSGALLAKLRAQVDLQAGLAEALGSAKTPAGSAESESEAGTGTGTGTGYGAFVAADQEFHRMLFEAAGVSELHALVRRLSGHVDRLRRLHLPAEGKMLAVVRDHRRIVDAIASGDPAAAQASLREHLSGTLGQAEEISGRFPEYCSV